MKNNALINQYKRLEKQVANITPQVYAGIALALSQKYGWSMSRSMNSLQNQRRYGMSV